MNKLKELFESALLTDESKAILQEAFDVAVSAKETELQAQYDEKLAESEKEIMTSIPAIVESAIAEELSVIAEEVAHARTLEVQYAEKLTAFKESYATKHDEEMKVLVAEAVAEEFEELKEDIDLAKKHQFVLALFDSFKGTYEQLFGSSDITIFDELKEAKRELDEYKREETLNSLLETLSGDKRVIAQTILEGVATDKLEAKFESIRAVLLKESAPATPQLNEQEGAEKQKAAGTIILENQDQNAGQDNEKDAMTLRLEKSLEFAKRR